MFYLKVLGGDFYIVSPLSHFDLLLSSWIDQELNLAMVLEII